MLGKSEILMGLTSDNGIWSAMKYLLQDAHAYKSDKYDNLVSFL